MSFGISSILAAMLSRATGFILSRLCPLNLGGGTMIVGSSLSSPRRMASLARSDCSRRESSGARHRPLYQYGRHVVGCAIACSPTHCLTALLDQRPMLRVKRRAGDAKREAEAALESAPAPERRLLSSRCA